MLLFFFNFSLATVLTFGEEVSVISLSADCNQVTNGDILKVDKIWSRPFTLPTLLFYLNRYVTHLQYIVIQVGEPTKLEGKKVTLVYLPLQHFTKLHGQILYANDSRYSPVILTLEPMVQMYVAF